MQNRINVAIENAQDAFWAAIVKEFPEITSGDLSPDTSAKFELACKETVTAWVHENVPKAQLYVLFERHFDGESRMLRLTLREDDDIVMQAGQTFPGWAFVKDSASDELTVNEQEFVLLSINEGHEITGAFEEEGIQYQFIVDPTGNLNHWTVSLNEDPGDKFTIIFNCWAEDADHASEQAESAYPGCIVINSTQI